MNLQYSISIFAICTFSILLFIFPLAEGHYLELTSSYVLNYYLQICVLTGILTLFFVDTWLIRLQVLKWFLTIGVLIGLLFFLFVLKITVVNPTYIDWVIQGDLEQHFLGWHIFRQEIWHFPVGKIQGFNYPEGTSIGYTDANPLFAIPLKLFSAWLPDNFQYIGIWLLLCFILQGFFSALLLSLFTRHLTLIAVGCSFFVLSPILSLRLGHDTLCAHWLLLAGLWLYFSTEKIQIYRFFLFNIILVAISAAIHPYLTVMVLGIVTATYARIYLTGKLSIWLLLLQWSLLPLIILLIWWQAGYFMLSGIKMISNPMGYYSMNLLSLFNPMGASVLLRDLGTVTEGQYEGANYFGAGALILLFIAFYELLRQPLHLQKKTLYALIPLLFLCIGFTLFAINRKIGLGNILLLELPENWFAPLAAFQSSGRFFWTVYYVILLFILVIFYHRATPRHALLITSFALSIQYFDLWYLQLSNSRYTYPAWENPLKSKVWNIAAPNYEHITLLNPRACGQVAAPEQPFLYLAGLHGLTFNDGRVARFDFEKAIQYCQILNNNLQQGIVSSNEIYILHPDFLTIFQKNAQKSVVCSTIDGFHACVTQESYERWKTKLEN